LAILGNGVLLVLKQIPHHHGAAPLIPALVTGVVALIAYLIGLRRQRTLSVRPLPGGITPRREVRLVGALVLVLTWVIAVCLFV
jgi:hypothetical protein